MYAFVYLTCYDIHVPVFLNINYLLKVHIYC
jgi:hypothetical protein